MTEAPGDEEELLRLVREAGGPPGGTAPVVTGGARLAGREAAARAAVGPAEPIFSLAAPGFAGIREYDPQDLTVTVGAGTRCSTLRAALADEGQWIPALELGPDRSAAGLVAAAEPGPFDRSHGTVRRHLLAVRAVTWSGRSQRWGRAVVKDVAGYDVKALWCGSRGRLGVLTEVTLRTWPRPEAGAWLSVEGDGAARDAVLDAGIRPDAVVLVRGPEGGRRTWLGFVGSPESVEARRGRADAWLARRGMGVESAVESLVPAGLERHRAAGRTDTREDEDPGTGERLVDRARWRATVRPSGLGALLQRLEAAGALGGTGALDRADVRLLPELGVARLELPSTAAPGDGTAAREALLHAAGEARLALEAGAPADLDAADARRDAAAVGLEESVVRALGGRARHWLGDWV